MAYCAALKKDPLYLFTKYSVEEYLADFLEAIWMPLLAYIQELYSYPIPLNTLPATPLTSATSKMDIVFKAKNFAYARAQPYNSVTSPVFQSLVSIAPLGINIKDGCTTALTVHIPKNRDHPFWQYSLNQCDDKLFACDKSEDTISFQVTRWGPLERLSQFSATQRAKDIIHNIRAALSNPTHLAECISAAKNQSLRTSNRQPDDCPILEIGMKMNYIWKCAKLGFSSVCMESIVDLAVNCIQNLINSNKLLTFSPVLKYYQVYLLILFADLPLDLFLYGIKEVLHRCRAAYHLTWRNIREKQRYTISGTH